MCRPAPGVSMAKTIISLLHGGRWEQKSQQNSESPEGTEAKKIAQIGTSVRGQLDTFRLSSGQHVFDRLADEA